jgi:hypothetical protein
MSSRQLLKDATYPAPPAHASAFMNNRAIDSQVVAPSDVDMLQTYSNRLGKESKLQGFAHFTEQQAMGLFTAGVGVIVNDQPFVLSSFVASREASGAVLWSARGLDNTQLPGTADRFSNVMEALRAMDDYMIHMARVIAQQAAPQKRSFFQRLFSG